MPQYEQPVIYRRHAFCQRLQPEKDGMLAAQTHQEERATVLVTEL
jgi:hypothetical protein